MIGRNMLSMSGLSLYRNAIQFGMNVAIAAFVTPADYGLIVFTTPFIVLIAMFTDLGMTAAITRAPRVDREQAGAAFAAMLAGGAGCAVLLALVAVPVERWTAMLGLASVMRGMAVVIVFSVAAATPRAMMERELRYGRIAGIEACAIAVAAAIGLGIAWHGGGVWSLVVYNLVAQALRAAAFGWSARGVLRPNAAFDRLRPLLAFGGWVLATNILNFLARNGDNLLIGAWLGAAAVGVYGLSYQFMLAPLMAITWPTSAILLATLRDRDPHGEEARAMVAGVMSATAMVTMPAMAYLTFGLAFPVHALLSSRWMGVPAIVAWLAPAGAIQAIASYNGVLLLVAGRARAQFALTILNAAVLVATFLFALPFGLLALVRAYTVATTLLSLVFIAMIVTLTGLGWTALLRALAPALVGTAAGLSAVALTIGPHPDGWPAWIAATGVYAAVVLAAYVALGAHVRRTVAVLMTRAAVGV